MKKVVCFAGFMLASAVCSLSAIAADLGLVAWWSFDQEKGKVTTESVRQIDDAIKGNFTYVPGARARALKFDGYTTRVVREASDVPRLVEALTIEAWIAPQTYSWNWTAIVDQAGDVIGEKPEAGELKLEAGLIGAKYNDPNFTSPGGTDLLKRVDHEWTGGYNDWSARWRGYIEAPTTGEVTFSAEVDNGLKLEIDKALVIDGWGRDKGRTGRMSMVRGQKYPIVLSYFQDGDPSFLRLYWSWEGQAKTLVDPAVLSHSERDEDYVKSTELGHKRPPPERNQRLFFGIDSEGYIGVKVMVNGQLRECTSRASVPLLKWSHIAATFDKNSGINLYINGEPVGSTPVKGVLTPAVGYNLLIGKSHKKMSPANTERGPSRRLLSNMIFDGLIDEVKIYDRSLSADQISKSYAAVKPRQTKPLTWRQMPSGPKDPNPRFGAAYCRLRYSEEWENLSRVGPHPDILVRFDHSPVKMLFWRGTAYGAVWVAENDKWMGDQSLERTGTGKSPWGCAEHMSDKQCRYSHVRLLENHDARVVVHWRYAVSDIVYGIFGADQDGWGEWADEYYYIYPDGVSARKQVLHSNHLSHEWQETIVLHQPGTRPEDNIELDALTWGNMDGETKTYTWKAGDRDDSKLLNATIQMVNLKAKNKPFLIFRPNSRPKLMRCCIEEQWSRFPWWNHWPVGQLPNDGRRTGVPDRPAHSSLAQSIEDSPVIVHDKENKTFTAVHLCGMSEKAVAELVPLARSWNYPAGPNLLSSGFSSKGYDRYQRAYVLACERKDKPSTLRLELPGSENSPVVNPALVVEGWGEVGVQLKLDGKKVERGGSFRFGHSHTLEGTNLIVWIKKQATGPVAISLSPTPEVSSLAAPDARKLREVEKKSDGLSRRRPLRLPSGPKGLGRFGAYYKTLSYDPTWDKLWKVSDHADVVVRFDEFDHRFVFWRGTSYIPCWATYDGAWYTNEFFERNAYLGGCSSMCEPMSDKQCRYSHVRIVESTDARVVVHWRYSPTDLYYQLPYRDEMTGWADWVDEYYTIYPDSVGVRKATIHTGSPQKDWIEYQEGIVINQPGTVPEDNINFNAVTFANLKGQSKTYEWTEDGGPPLRDPPDQPCIQVINFKNPHKPFTVVNPDGVRIKVYRGHGSNSHFNWWNHWPVAQELSDTTEATSATRPSHSSLTHIEWKQHSQEGISRTWIMLNGMTDKPAAELAPLAKSWLYAPQLKLTGTAYISKGYDQTQRAYVLSRKDNRPSPLKFTLAASENSPAINPAVVVKNWGSSDACLQVDGEAVQRGKSFRQGHHRTLRGRDLIAWFKAESTKPINICLSPTAD